MATLVIDQRGAQLQHQSGALILHLPDKRPQSISLNLIDRLVLAAAVQVDSALFSHLAERGISLVSMPGRGARRSAFMYSMGHGDAGRRLNQYCLVLDGQAALQWAIRFVCLKNMGQLRLLRLALTKRPEHRMAILQGSQRISDITYRARRADSLQGLRGLEGAASAQFFQAYQTLFAESLSFTNRNRRPPLDPVNACLSFGYTLAHGEAVAAIAKAGLDPMLGFLHDIHHGRESLACDLVELARPRIEHFVWRLFADQAMTAADFTIDKGACRMGKAARRLFFQEYEKHAAIHRRWLHRYARAISRACSSHQDASILKET